MAHEISRWAVPGRAASAINAGAAVALVGAINAASAGDNLYIRATTTAQIMGLSRASVAQGQALEVDVEGVGKARAAASLGAGAFVGPASGVATDGLVPMALTVGSAMFGRVKLGQALENAAAGDIFSVFIQPDQLL